MKFICFVSLFSFVLFSTAGRAGEVTLAVASNFTAPMKKIAAVFEKETGHQVRISPGSSGKLYAQIKNGAPFDIFFSADQDKPEKLVLDGLGSVENRFTYAIGALVLWSKEVNLVDGEGHVLRNGNFRHLAIANPKLAPYGMAAQQVLQQLELDHPVKDKLVVGENIAQAYQFVRSGNAELGFVALSQIFVNGRLDTGSAWIIPENLYAPMKQDALLLKKGEGNDAARQFLQFIQSRKARGIIGNFGYKTAMAQNKG